MLSHTLGTTGQELAQKFGKSFEHAELIHIDVAVFCRDIFGNEILTAGSYTSRHLGSLNRSGRIPVPLIIHSSLMGSNVSELREIPAMHKSMAEFMFSSEKDAGTA